MESKEREILFSGEMVRAILDGRKSQTRRVVRRRFFDAEYGEYGGECTGAWATTMPGENFTPELVLRDFPNPYGQPGDRLWVRETSIIAPSGFAPEDGNVRDERGERRIVQYLATHPDREPAADYGITRATPSIHMPRWASRITLEITDVRVERIRDISVADALAEGCCVSSDPDEPTSFHNTWNACYPGSWDRNDWVWCVSFNPLPPSRRSPNDK